MDWFERLTGFAETDYATTKSRLRVEGQRLRSSVNGQSYAIGRLEVVSLATLRSRARPILNGPRATTVGDVRGDVRALHLEPENEAALVQVASQFNLLEMVGPQVTPEDGVTGYQFDLTQGPACAMAAGAATICRNYFVPVGEDEGQTRHRQINCIDDLGTALGHGAAPLWDYRNGYVLPSTQGLRRIRKQMESADALQREVLRGQLKVGIHWDVARRLLGAVLNGARPCGSNRVLLTRLGGGAFGNVASWIDQAVQYATRIVANAGLQVVHVSR